VKKKSSGSRPIPKMQAKTRTGPKKKPVSSSGKPSARSKVSPRKARGGKGKPTSKSGVSPRTAKVERSILPESGSLLRSLMLHAPDVIIIMDREGTILSINRTVTERTVGEAVGSSLFDTIRSEYHPILRRTLDHVFEKAEPYVYEAAGAGAGGTMAWYSSQVSPIKSGDKVVAALLVARDITERKRTEDALRRSEETVRALLNATEDLVVLIDIEGTVVVANDAWIRRMVKSPDRATGHCIYDLFSPDEAKARRAIVDEVIRSAQPVRYEEALGEEVYAGSVYPLLGADRKVERLAVFARNVTVQKRAEEQIGLLSSAVEQAREGVAVSDMEGNLLFVNPAFADLHGYAPDELIGKHLSIFHSADQLPAVEAANRQIQKTGVFDGEIWHRNRDGTVFPTLMHNSLLEDRTGHPVGMIGTLRDITERKQAEDALRRSEERYRTIVQDQTELICRFLPDTTLTFVNDAYARSFGRTPEDLIGSRFLPLIPEEDRKRVLRALSALSSDEPVATHEHRVLLPGGKVGWQQWTNRVFLDDGGNAVEFQSVGRDVTERRRAEDALRDSEERFRGIFENAMIGFYRTTPEGRILMANSALVGMLGYTSPHELSKRNLEDEGYEPEYCRQKFKKQIEETGQVLGLESVWTRKDGTPLYVRESARVFRDPDGAVLYYEGTVEDITERRKAEEELRRSEERFGALVANTSDLISVVNTDGTIQYLSPSVKRMCGYEPEDAVGRNMLESLHPEDAERMQALLVSVAGQSGMSASAEYRVRRVEGDFVWLESILSNQVENRSIDGIIINSRDISDRKRRQVLRERTHRMDECLGRVSGRFIHPADFDDALNETLKNVGELLNVGRVTHSRLGPNGKAMGVIHQWVGVGVKRRAWRVNISSLEWMGTRLRNNEPVVVSRTDDLPAPEKRLVSDLQCETVVVLPILVGVDLVALLSVMDGTPNRTWEAEELRFLRSVAESIARAEERTYAEAEKARLREQVHEAMRARSIAIMAGGIAQDFRDTLFTVMGSVTLLKSGVGEDPVLAGHLERIEREAQRMARMVDQLYAYGRGILPEAKRIQIADCLEKAIGRVSECLPPRARITRNLSPSTFTVQADPESTTQALANVLTNALEAIPEGGEVRVRMENADRIPFSGATETGAREGPYVHVHIADNGCGMPSETLTRVFEPYFTTKRIGRGLGLSETHGVIKHFGGSIFVDSEVGRGTNVHIYLPAEGPRPNPETSGP